jgi:hypothetical protein
MDGESSGILDIWKSEVCFVLTLFCCSLCHKLLASKTVD